MANRTTDIWNDDDGEDERPRRHRLRKFLLFFLTLLAVLAVVLAAAWRDGTGLDALRRYFAYGEDAGAGAGYVYDASASNRFAQLGNTLVVLSDTLLSLVDGSGNVLWSTAVNMAAPALNVGGGYAVAYEVGGAELYVVDEQGLKYQLEADEEEPYIAATLNSAGELTVTAQKQKYKGCVTVYDGGGNPKFTFNSSERYVPNAYATNDGNYLAAVTLGQSGGAFAASVVLYDLTKTEPVGSYAAGDGMCLDMEEISGRLTMVCDNALVFGSTTGGTPVSYDYGDSFLRDFDLHGEGYAVLLLNRYQSGSTGRLVTVGADGLELASLAVNDEILSVSAMGRYIAVLYANQLVIYNSQLEEYASLSGTDYAREALVGADGSALLLAAEQAVRFLP